MMRVVIVFGTRQLRRRDGAGRESAVLQEFVGGEKSLAEVERVFRRLKGHRSFGAADSTSRRGSRAGAHFLGMLAYYVEWHVRRA